MPTESIPFDLWTGYDEKGKYHMYSADELVVMQYTGLKDKNGREIYEGDIVQCRKRHTQTFTDPLTVKWYDTGFRLMTKTDFPYDFFDRKPFKVVGNIYENPELIK